MPAIPTAAIDIPTGRHRTPPEDVKDLTKSMLALGLINPISVVENTDQHGRYWLLAGHRRLLAVRQIGWEHVDAKVFTVDDVHRELIEISENLHRLELTNSERDKGISRYNQLLKTIHPEIATAGKKTSLANLRQFQGQTEDNGEAPPEMTQAKLIEQIAESQNLSPSTVEGAIKRAAAFNEDESKLLDQWGITLKQRDKIAAIKDDSKRGTMLNLIAIGQTFEQSWNCAVKGKAMETLEQPDDEPPPDAEPSLKELLESCPIRHRGINKYAFDHDASLYYNTKAARERFAREIGWAKIKKTVTSYGPYYMDLQRFLTAEHPRQWKKCADCHEGYTKDGKPCSSCTHRCGFFLR